MIDRLIKITTAFAVVAVACVAAIISYQHAYELVRSHGESGVTAGSCRSPWTDSSGPRPWLCSTPAVGTRLYHGWLPGAWA